jgi:hypothetical protein
MLIPPISQQSPSPIIRGWYNRPVSGRSTQSPTPRIKKKKNIHILYSSVFIGLTKTRRIRWARDVACVEEMRNKCTVWVRKLEGSWQLGRPLHNWEDNIKVCFKEMVWEGEGRNRLTPDTER